MPSNRERFVQLAEARTKRTIKQIRLIGNLSNRSNYKHTREDVNTIFRRVEKELRAAKARFEGGESATDIEFSLDDGKDSPLAD